VNILSSLYGIELLRFDRSDGDKGYDGFVIMHIFVRTDPILYLKAFPYVSSFLSSPTRETQRCNLIFIWKCIGNMQSSEKGPFTRITPFN
jgi:hypothetical protein